VYTALLLKYRDGNNSDNSVFEMIVSRDFEVCFLVPIDRLYISALREHVLLLFEFNFCVEFFYFCVSA
jgi:hypothetical protein